MSLYFIEKTLYDSINTRELDSQVNLGPQKEKRKFDVVEIWWEMIKNVFQDGVSIVNVTEELRKVGKLTDMRTH